MTTSEAMEFFQAGADMARLIKDAETRVLREQIVDMRLQLTHLYNQKGWTCGCGHTNGINLAWCAACFRMPNGRHKDER